MGTLIKWNECVSHMILLPSFVIEFPQPKIPELLNIRFSGSHIPEKPCPFCAILKVWPPSEHGSHTNHNIIKICKRHACIWTSFCTECSRHKAKTEDAIHDKVEQLEDKRFEKDGLISFLCLTVYLRQCIVPHFCPTKGRRTVQCCALLIIAVPYNTIYLNAFCCW